MAGVSWIWVVVAVPLLVAGVVCVARFMLGDRSRGRLRCPKCWYDMDGGGEKCPECGRVVRSGRDLRRTRRPKRWAVVGVGLLVMGGASLATRQAVVHGTVSLVPDGVLVAGFGRWTGSEWSREITGRAWRGELGTESQRRLYERCWSALERSDDVQVVMAAAGLIGSAEFKSREGPWRVSPSDLADESRVVRVLLRLVRHEHAEMQTAGAAVLQAYPDAAKLLVPAVLTQLAYDPGHRSGLDAGLAMALRDPRVEPLRRSLHRARYDPAYYSEFMSFMGDLAASTLDSLRTRELLLTGLASDSDEIAALSAWLLRARFADDEACRIAAAATFDLGRLQVAPIILAYVLRGPLDGEAAEVVRRVLRCEHVDLVEQALSGLARRGEEASQFLPDVEALLEGDAATEAARTFAMVGGDRELAAWVVLEVMHDPGRRDGGEMYLLGDIGWHGEPVLDTWSAWLESDQSWARLAAACSVLRSGTPQRFDRAEVTKIAVRALLDDQDHMTNIFWALVESGDADLGAIIEVLEQSKGAAWGTLVRMLSSLGSPARLALPWLRLEAQADDPNVAFQAELAVRRIEWHLEHGDPPSAPRDDR